MLPDFPKLKKLAQTRIVSLLLNEAKRRTGILSVVPEMRIFEGNRWAYTTDEDSEFTETSSQFQINDEQLNANSIEDNIELMRKAIDDIVDQIAKGVMQKANEAAAANHPKFAGVTEITEESLLKMMETYQMDFTPDGRPIGEIMINPANREVLASIAENPEFHRKWEEMINQQRQKFNDRESHRKLVG